MPLPEYTKNSVLGMWDGDGTGGYTKLHVAPQYKLTLGAGTPKEGEGGAAEGGLTQKIYLELRQCNRRAKVRYVVQRVRWKTLADLMSRPPHTG